MAPHLESRGFCNDTDRSFWPVHPPDSGFASDIDDTPQDQDLLEPIAVVGMSLKFPQDATSPDSLWKMLLEKRCAVTPFPADRMSVTGSYHPDKIRRDTFPVCSGNFFKDDAAAFDAPFFSISAMEAAALDPQQRGLLETTYRALENAGMPLEELSGSKTSVYTGCFTNDWQQLSVKDCEQSSTYAGLGIEPCMLANRISWFFGFAGVSVNLDSACSSSLVALDIACKDLRSRDVNMSIVAGTNVIISPDMMHVLGNLSMLSIDGRCYSFDHRANGYARGEGYAVLILKRLSDALLDGDTIRTVIRSTGSNSDGYTPGITQPSRDAQTALIRECYEKAGLGMSNTRFFEAHGTGTAIGDPVEATAIGTAFRSARTIDDPVYVGAVKSNLGHLGGASGIAGVIKAILVLEKAVIPPNANFEQLNSRIDAEFLRLRFPQHSIPWPTKGLRRASINSFGFGGTNSHAVLDDPFHYLHGHGLTGNHCTVQDPPLRVPPNERSLSEFSDQVDKNVDGEAMQNTIPKILVWSAKDQDGLKRLVAGYHKHFSTLTIPLDARDRYLHNLAHTLACRRSSLPWRSFVVQVIPNPALGFIFTGQGAQWAGMGRDLVRYPIFERSLREAEGYMAKMGCGWSLREELLRSGAQSRINEPELSQPLCTAIQVGLVDLLQSFGVRPNAVVGHSSGEIAAAYCLGAISDESAWRIAYYRGLYAALIAKSGQPGGMVSVNLSSSAANLYIDRVAQRFGSYGLIVACINSPRNVTISGDEGQIMAMVSLLNQEKIFARRLLVNVAYHSSHMESTASEYERSIQRLERGHRASDSMTMISSVTGQRISYNELCTAQYCVKNMVSPVRFSDAIAQLCAHSAQKNRKKLDLSHK